MKRDGHSRSDTNFISGGRAKKSNIFYKVPRLLIRVA
jgi:hypothetical protein